MRYLKRILLPVLTFLFLSFTGHIKASQMNTHVRDTVLEQFYKKVTEGDLVPVKDFIESGKIKVTELNRSHNPWVMMSYAALSGNRDLFDYLLTQGGDIKLADQSGETALHWAAWQGNLEACKWLVEGGADVEAYYRANGGLTPLRCAAESGNLELVKYLVAKGADPLSEDQQSGSSAMRGAAYKGHYEIFRYFADLQPKTYDWQMVLLYGIIGNSLDIVKFAVEQKGANVNKEARHWKLPIHEAAYQWFGNGAESVRIIRYLQSKGARLKDINNGDIFPWALENCTEEVIAYLLEQGVKPDFLENERGWTPLALSLDKGSLVVAKALLGKDKNPSFRGVPLVIFFADGLYNSPAIINFLIENGINKNHYTEAFFRSVQQNDLESVKLLLTAGADINFTDNKGLNALYYSQNIELSKYLIEKGIDITNKNVLELSYNNFILIRALNDAGVELSLPQENLDTGLGQAALLGDKEMVKFFIQKGANVNSGSKAPLILNAMQGYSDCGYSRDEKVQISSDIAQILIDAGADINAQDVRGRTALHYVSDEQYCRIGIGPIPIGSRYDREMGAHGEPAMPPMQYHDRILEVLLQAGANVNNKDKDGNTPAILAVKGQNPEAFRQLCKAGADLTAKDNSGKSIIEYITNVDLLSEIKAVGLLDSIPKDLIFNLFERVFYDGRYGEGMLDKMKVLIDCGIDINRPFNNYDKPTILMKTLSESYYNNREQFVRFLLKNGADINAKDSRGRTALFYAVGNSNLTLKEIKYLINMGAKVNDLDKYHTKPYMVASFRGRDDVVKLLEEHGSVTDYEAEWWYGLKENFHTGMTRLPYLISKGVDINMKAAYSVEPASSHGIREGMTLLMFLSQFTVPDYIKKVLEMGANVNIRDNEGNTALHYAEKSNHEVVEILEAAGAVK